MSHVRYSYQGLPLPQPGTTPHTRLHHTIQAFVLDHLTCEDDVIVRATLNLYPWAEPGVIKSRDGKPATGLTLGDLRALQAIVDSVDDSEDRDATSDSVTLTALYAAASVDEAEVLDDVLVRAGLARRCLDCGTVTPTNGESDRKCPTCIRRGSVLCRYCHAPRAQCRTDEAATGQDCCAKCGSGAAHR